MQSEHYNDAQEYLRSYYSSKGIIGIEACDDFTVSRKCSAIRRGLINPPDSEDLAGLEVQLLKEQGFQL
jgi:hypothetical protein